MPTHLVDAVPRKRATGQDPGPLARILLRLRGERGWKQKEVAARAPGITQAYYSSLETGAILRPADEKLDALDVAFGLEAGTLRRRLHDLAPQTAPYVPHNPLYDILVPGPDGEIVALVRRVPSARQSRAAELIKRQAIEVLKMLAEDDAPPYS